LHHARVVVVVVTVAVVTSANNIGFRNLNAASCVPPAT
jgi:hypothetical protein